MPPTGLEPVSRP